MFSLPRGAVLRRGLVATLAIGLPAAALAADLPTKKEPAAPPVYAPVGDSGFYAGAFVGGVLGAFNSAPGSASNSGGFATGTLVGYKWRLSPWTFGLEGDVSWNTLTQKFKSAGGFPATQLDSVYSVHARGRIGYTMGQFEPFIAGGFVLTDIAQSRQSPAEYDGASSRRPGWTIGAGVDANLNFPIIGQSVIRAEYLYDQISPTNMNLNGVVYRTSGGEHFARLGLIKYFDSGTPLPEASFQTNWDGNYFGVLGGYSGAQINTSPYSFNANGGSVGVYSGRNWMFGQGMLGYEGSTSFGAINGDGPQPLAASTHYHDYFLSDLRGRAGWAFGRFMPYAAAGLAWDMSSQTDKANGNYRGDLLQTSATIGAGVEYMLTDRVSVRAEYAYAHSLSSLKTKLDSEDCCSQTRDSNTFRIGLGYFLR